MPHRSAAPPAADETSCAAHAALLPADLVLAEPQTAGPLTILPLLAKPGEFEYWSFAEASSRGFRLTERESASINDLRAANPLGVAVLLCDAEVVEGARQDRVADAPVLLGAGMRLRVPVCCVEEGRWDDGRHREAFAPSAVALPPSLRAVKNRRVRARLRDGRPPRADQDQLWATLAGTLEAAQVRSETNAVRDLYAGRRALLAALESSVSRRDGQVGALVFLHGRPVVLDYVSRPEVWAALWRPLLRGYCVDALDDDARGPEVRAAEAENLLAELDAMPPVRHRRSGIADLITLDGDRAAGTGLMLGDELIQASLFAG